LATAPFCAAWRALEAADLGREADAFRLRELEELRELEDPPAVEPARFELDRAFPDEPFLLVDLFEPPLEELLLEDFVFCAIDIASLGSLPAARFAPAVNLRYPVGR
jgi:hypothetical protein